MPNYIHIVKKIEAIYDSIISNDINLQKGTNKDNQKSGYSIEKNGTSYVERQQQVLKDASGKEIGDRTITWNTDMQNGTESIETIGTLENSDGKYLMRETSETFEENCNYIEKNLQIIIKILEKKNNMYIKKIKMAMKCFIELQMEN